MVSQTHLKALVLTSAPRLFYVDDAGRAAKACGLGSLAEESGGDLSVDVPGQGRVRLSPVLGRAADWVAARDGAQRARRAPSAPPWSPDAAAEIPALPAHLRLDANGSRGPTVPMVERWRV